MLEKIAALPSDALLAACAAALALVLLAVLACAVLSVSRGQQRSREQAAALEARLAALSGSSEAVRAALERELAASRSEVARMREDLQTELGRTRQASGESLLKMRESVSGRLAESISQGFESGFSAVSRQLTDVHEGLGQMKTLAEEVGSLQRALCNVKVRGTFGETQLRAILSDILDASQYAENIATRAGSRDRVEFAVRMPGASGSPVWMPVDSKFPVEDYLRLLQADEAGDGAAASAARTALAARVLAEARKIAGKYLEPPATTGFAVLFLATEGLFLEVLRVPGLAERVRRECRVMLAGPSTLAALLESLRVGFQTLSVEQHARQTWQTLASVRSEFERYDKALGALRANLAAAEKGLDALEVRRRAMLRSLRDAQGEGPQDAQEPRAE